MVDVLAQLQAHQVAQRRRFKPIETGVNPDDYVTDLQREFIDYMLTPGHGTQKDFAVAHDVNPCTITSWKKSRFFMDEWDKRAKKINGGIERVQRVVDALFTAATQNGDVKAMQLYLQYVEKFTPTTKVISEDKGVEGMTDDELAEQLAAAANNLRKGA